MKAEILLTNDEVIVFEPKWLNMKVGLSEMLSGLNKLDVKVFECLDVQGTTHFINMNQVIRISEYTGKEKNEVGIKIDRSDLSKAVKEFIDQTNYGNPAI